MNINEILKIEIKPIMHSSFTKKDEVKAIFDIKIPHSGKLTATKEKIIFLQYNYIRYCAFIAQENIKKNLDIEQNKTNFLYWKNKVHNYEDRLIRANMGLVKSTVSKLYNLDQDDLESNCLLALLKAIRTFDVQRGKFSTWAMSNFNFVIKEYISFVKRNKEIAYDNDHFKAIGLPVTDDSPQDSIREIIVNNSAKLTLTELKIIRLRYFSDKKLTHTEIGKKFKKSGEWSRLTERKSLDKLKKLLIKV